ncbi:2-C-methyl-D-erythritol 4-phosphate cytidylyltransferase [Octadecabacter sp.]|nr:2-C-methyl-D-erythritol 4-phosphate cytidylyltransferase [Octadecabacter sp.]
MKNAVVILAGGSGTRYSNSVNKSLEHISGIPLWKIVLNKYIDLEIAQEYVVVCNREIISEIEADILINYKELRKVLHVIPGGSERQQSILRGLQELHADEINAIFIHEAARPIICKTTLEECKRLVELNDAVLPIQHSRDGLLIVNDENDVVGYNDRRTTVCGIGPEVMRYHIALSSFEEAEKENLLFPESCSLLAYYGINVKTFLTKNLSIKVTHPNDLLIAQTMMSLEQ